jgi:hypothetical protein
VEVLKDCDENIENIGRKFGKYGETYPKLLDDIRDLLQALEPEGPHDAPKPLERHGNPPRSINTEMDSKEVGQEKTQEAAKLVSLKPRLLRVLDGSLDVITDVGRESGYNSAYASSSIEGVIDMIAPEWAQELEQLIQESIVRGKEPERLKAINAELLEENQQLKVANAELLEAVKASREMFYTLGDRDTQESKDCFALYELCDAAIAKAKPYIAWTPQPSVPKPEPDIDLELDR